MSIGDGAQGSGNGQVRYQARPNSGAARTGTLTIAGQTVVITQGDGCSYTLQPGSADIGQTGGTGRVAVNTSPGCTWTATSAAPWVAVSAAKATGAGAFTFSVDENAMGVPARTGSIMVADQTFRVDQAPGPPCTYTLTGNIQWFPRAGAPWSFLIATGASCAWTALPSAPWITITSPSNGTGNGRVIFNVGPNPAGNPGRAGTITVGNSVFTVDQNAIY